MTFIKDLTDTELIEIIKEVRPMTQEIYTGVKPYINELVSRGSIHKLDKNFIKQRTWKR